MEMLNIWVFLTSTEPVSPFGMTISWLLVLVGDTVVPPPIRTGEFSLGYLMEVLQLCGVVPSLPVLLISPGVRKLCALLIVVSVMITFEVGI